MPTKVFRAPVKRTVKVASGLKTASMQAIKDAVAEIEPPERLVVEGATVVCTQMYEPESQSKMKKTDTSNGVMLQGAYKLGHKDIEFEPKFEKCRYCLENGEADYSCEPEIDEEQWHDYDEEEKTNGEFGILEEKSFMVCKKGFGLLYISEDGQRPCDMKRLLAMLAIKLGDRALLGRLMCAAFGGDPVNMATGNFIFARTDLEIGGGIPLKFQRFYNTFDEQVTALGKGWRHPYDIHLTETKEGVVITFEDGHDEIYKLGDDATPNAKKEKDEPTKGYRLSKPGETLSDLNDKAYEAPDGNFSQLLKVRNGHRLVKADGTTLYFNADGNLTKIYDANQVEIILTYENKQLIRIASLSGSFNFTYEFDKIATLTDHTGRKIAYTYEGDLLTSATDPLGNIRTYAYDEQGRFLNEINPEGHLVVENEYDDQNRTIKQRYADQTEMSYIYEDREVQNISETLKTEFISQDGSKTIYHRDIQYRTVGIEYPDYGEIQTEYNWKHQKISETDKIGARTYYNYDEKGNLSKITNPLKEVTELSYDDNNKLTGISAGGINKLSSEYDSTGNLVAASDALKRQVRFSYDKETRGLPTHIVQPDGSVIKVKYDKKRNVTEMTDAFGVTTHYDYDSLNRVIKTIDGNGNDTKFSYDLNNNIAEVINAEGNSRTYTYNKAKKLTHLTDFNGAEITFSYNSLNKPETITDQLGRTTKLTYDQMWNVSKVLQPNGAEIGFIYDENNRLVTIQKPDEHEIHYEYDMNGNKTKIVDEAGNATYLTYDKLQRITEVSNDEGTQQMFTYNTDGQITSVTDAMEHTIYLEYDEAGQLIKETNALGDFRSYTYTALGKIETVTDEADRTTTYEYAAGGRLTSIHHPTGNVEHFTYDNNSNIKTHTNPLGLTTTYLYDCLNRVTEIIGVNGSSKKYTYDQVDHVTSMTNELEHSTHYAYTLTGQLEKVIDPLGNETHYVYDLLDQLVEVKQLGEVDGTDGVAMTAINPTDRITTYQRNLLGQVTSVTDALGQVEYYNYSPTGKLIKKIDKDAYITEYDYTIQGDVSHIKYGDGKEVHLAYNALRQLTEVKDSLGITRIEVDALGRPLNVVDHHHERVEYSYGKAGERKSIKYPNGKLVQYHYDELLRLTRIQDEEQFTNYVYDKYSRLIEKQYPNNTASEYKFNEWGQLQSLIHSKSSTNYAGKEIKENLDQFHYEYDLMGNKIEINKIRKGVKDQGRYKYQYDPLNRLTQVMRERETLRSYRYDVFGNRTRKLEKGKEISYNYNSLNQLISMRDEVLHEYQYDGRGNLEVTKRNDEITHEYFFGANNRLEEALNHEKHLLATYDYNGLGHRVGKKIFDDELNPLKQIDDVIDLSKQYNNLLQRSENGSTTNFAYDSGVLSASSDQGNHNYLLDDLGSPLRLVDGTGSELDTFSYDEFGTQFGTISSTKQPFGFTGYQVDDISSTLFAQARQYDPNVGRFISEDKIKGFIEAPFTLNQYTYSWNDPMNLVDLDGKWPQWASDLWDNIRGVGSSIREGIQDLTRDMRRAVDLLTRGPFNGFGWQNISPAMNLADERLESSIAFAERHGLPHARGNLADAYRHFTWMFEETVARGASGARFIGDQNELVWLDSLFRGSPRNYMLAMFDMDAIKDLWNNSLGIEMGSCSDHESSSSYDAFRYAQANGWLIEHENYVADRLGIVPDSDGNVLGSWDLRANNIRFTDNYGTTVLCLYTREHTRTPHPFGGGN